MDIRIVIGAVVGFVIWAARTHIEFVLFGHLFIIPVLVVVMFFLALAIVLLIALIVRSLMTGQTVLGS